MSKYIPSTRPNRAISNSLNPHKDRIIELYRQGLGTRPIAKEIGHGHTHTAVYKALIRWGVKEDRPQWNEGRKFIPGGGGAKAFITPEIERELEITRIAHQTIMEHYKEEQRAAKLTDAAWGRPWAALVAKRHWDNDEQRGRGRAYYMERRKAILAQQKARRATPEGRAARKDYISRYRSDPVNRIKHNLSVRMAAMVRGIINGRKFHKSMDMLGCSEAELKEHLESKFTKRMTWDNYGSYWHVDHIVPISFFNLLDEQEMMRGCHFSNLRPLTAKANLRRGNRVGVIQGGLGL